MSVLGKSADKGAMAKKNGKWVVGVIFALVALLAFLSVQFKKDITRRSDEKKAAEEQSR